MANVLQEVTESNINRDHVERRVADWEKRVGELFSMIKTSLPADWTVERKASDAVMYEPLMEKFGLTPRKLPIVDVFRNGERLATFEPRGLWIIGANGRVDVVTAKGERYLITDGADNFERPRWSLSPYFDREKRIPFSVEALSARLQS